MRSSPNALSQKIYGGPEKLRWDVLDSTPPEGKERREAFVSVRAEMFLDSSGTEFGSTFGLSTGCGDNMTSAETKEVHMNPTYNGLMKAIVSELRKAESRQIGIF